MWRLRRGNNLNSLLCRWLRVPRWETFPPTKDFPGSPTPGRGPRVPGNTTWPVRSHSGPALREDIFHVTDPATLEQGEGMMEKVSQWVLGIKGGGSQEENHELPNRNKGPKPSSFSLTFVIPYVPFAECLDYFTVVGRTNSLAAL